MSEFEDRGNDPPGGFNPVEDSAPGSGTAGPELDLLPPPAFPPGPRRASVQRNRDPEGLGERLGLPESAFISPETPVRRIGEFSEDAFISPDEPLRPRRAASGDGAEAEEAAPEGDATGMGMQDPEPFPSQGAGLSDPLDPDRIADLLEALARSVRETGDAALPSDPTTSSFESVMRGYVAGYLTKRTGR